MINIPANKTKFFSIDELAEILEKVREGKKVVLCHGVFDLLHIGHIKYFEEAKQQGDILVVTVTPDRFVNKGPERPAFNESLRVEAIVALSAVDYVAVNLWPTAVETINLLKPDLYVKGPDYSCKEGDLTGKIIDEELAVKKNGGELYCTHGPLFSSSNLINNFFSNYSDEQQVYLKNLAKKYPADEILSYLDRMKDLSVLVIGEAIIDTYTYCSPIGVTTKDPIIAIKYESEEMFAGGIIAVANHVAKFAKTVHLVSMIGDQDKYIQFLQNSLSPNISTSFFQKRNSPTIVKQRYIDRYPMQKMIEVHRINDETLDTHQSNKLWGIVNPLLSQFDLTIIMDFGHGMMTPDIISKISSSSGFLAVNSQTNSGNRGFNLITRYPLTDFITLNGLELSMAVRNKHGDIKEMIKTLGTMISSNLILATNGKQGNICYRPNDGEMIQSPALAQKVVDRIGAGDATIAIASLGAYLGAPMEIIGFLGNVVSAQAVATIGHRESIDPISASKFITTLLK